jgi:hypothetical protein
MVSDPMRPAERKLPEKPSDGVTAVARVTRLFTVTTKASPFAQDGACEDFFLVRATSRQAACCDCANKH